ncbi:MAG TPA: hypothetical protein VFF09_05065 [archaeon]|nr:hypothetical protein [archaeon]
MPSSDVVDELDDNFGNWVALILRGQDFTQDVNKAFVKKLANTRNLGGVYITVNKPFSFIERSFRKSDIKMDNIYFVDMVSKYVDRQGKPEAENCSFVDSPSNLTMLAITFMQAAKMMKAKKADAEQPIFVVVDSINTFLVYNEENVVKKFFHFLISKSRELGCKCVLLSSDSGDVSSLNSLVADFSDKVVRYGV